MLDDERLAAGAAAFALAFVTWIIKQGGAIPRYFEQKKYSKRNTASIIDGAKRDMVMRSLKDTGAKYIHLIRYHNGGGHLKKGSPIHLSVDIEILGDSCDHCITHCRQFKGYKVPIQPDWQNIKIQGSWFTVVRETVTNPEVVNVVRYEQLDLQHQHIWEGYNIKEYHEIFVCHMADCFYCIGLSFCSRFAHKADTAGLMSLASRNLANLL